MKILRSFLLGFLSVSYIAGAGAQNQPQTQPSTPIPMDQLGAVAGKQYHGDGLSIIATPDGAQLRCAFQRLEGQATPAGLWLRSTANGSSEERFRVMAIMVGRRDSWGAADSWTVTDSFHWKPSPLPSAGIVNVADNVTRFIRDGLTEEYSVSVDGVRQDFIIEQRPGGKGELRVELDVTGAKAEPLVNGARLVLDGSERKLAYNRLHVTDARGQELTARLEVRDATHLNVVVDDAAAIYPVRIDPTFSDANWISMGGIPGVNGPVSKAVADESGNLYIGGNFTVVGDVIANRVAKWDGSKWSALGSGIGGSGVGGANPYITALAVSGSDLYAGGYFTNAGGVLANRIAKWDGTNWSALGSGMNGYSGGVFALAVSAGELYAGGDFTSAGGIAASRIAKWNGSSWSPLGLGTDSVVFALAVSGSDVYAGGAFETVTNSGGAAVTVNCIAKWDGSSWTELGSGMNNTVVALAVAGSDVYAGGGFTMAGDTTVNHIAKWNGNTWSALGSGMNHTLFTTVLALAVSGNDLYVGGGFTTVTNSGGGAVVVNSIAKWDGSNWSALGTGMGDGSGGSVTVSALVISGSNVYAGGGFTTAGGNAADSLAIWTGNNWTAIGSGLDKPVSALAVSGSDLFAGGSFMVAGGSVANCVAKWNGSSWTALGLGLNSNVVELAVSDGNVYAGGNFTTATNPGGLAVVVNYIAKWDGSNWAALGLGMNNSVYALAASGSNVYAGGRFTNAGGVAAQRIAKWNGSSWTALGLGMSSSVLALAVSGNDVYAGGLFTSAGGITANRIARWDGTNWTTLGSGMNDQVSALAIFGNNVYVGGAFTNAGGIAANRIARWRRSGMSGVWMAMGSGVNNFVSALAVSGSNVYAGGTFTSAGGVAANRIAKWTGTNWTTLGSGMDGPVSALAVSGGDLYVGGGFTTAGGKVSGYVAKAIIDVAPGRFNNLVYSPASGFSCTFLDATVGKSYRIQTSSSLVTSNWTDFTNFTYTTPIVITDASVNSDTNKLFRAVTP